MSFAHKLPAQVFKAWRIGTSYGPERSEAVPVEIKAESPDDALHAAMTTCAHKDHLAVLQCHAGRNRNTLRLYAIKRESKVVYRKNPETGEAEPTRSLYPVLLFSLPVASFNPKEPFQITRDTSHAEIVGIDPELVEQK